MERAERVSERVPQKHKYCTSCTSLLAHLFRYWRPNCRIMNLRKGSSTKLWFQICCEKKQPTWGFMIQIDLSMFFRWVGFYPQTTVVKWSSSDSRSDRWRSRIQQPQNRSPLKGQVEKPPPRRQLTTGTPRS